MKSAKGTVFRYGDNVDTDVIIPARYLNVPDPKELAKHCMEDIDTEFATKVKEGDIIAIKYASKTLEVRVLSVNEYVSKSESSSMYEVLKNE